MAANDPKKSQFDAATIDKMDIRGLSAGYDYAALVQTTTVDTYSFKQGGSGGTVLCTVAITYTDSTKAVVDHWTVS